MNAVWAGILTHAPSFLAGAGVTYLLCLHGHLPHHRRPTGAFMAEQPKRERDGLPTWMVVVVASLVVIVLGVQTLLAQQDNAERDRERARDAQVQRDRTKALDRQADALADRATCLNDFGTALVATINARNAANRKVTEAQERKDNAMDAIVLAVAGAREVPPTATAEDLDAALQEFVKARQALSRAKGARDATLAAKPYVAPDALCQE